MPKASDDPYAAAAQLKSCRGNSWFLFGDDRIEPEHAAAFATNAANAGSRQSAATRQGHSRMIFPRSSLAPEDIVGHISFRASTQTRETVIFNPNYT